MPLLLRLLLLSTIATIPLANAASPDCTLAHTPREHAICTNPQLSTLDAQLTLAYARLRSHLSPSASTSIQSDQRDWLHWLDDVCPPNGRGLRANLTACLTTEYTHRLKLLVLGPRLPDGHVLYPRTRYVLALPSKLAPDDTAALADKTNPGYGTGTFAWPQIDTPTPHETAWNQAILAYAIELSGDSTHHPTSFDTAVDSSNTLDISVAIRSANSQLLSADLTVVTFGYGASHPLTAVNTFTWWLDLARPLDPADLFSDSTDWQTSLVDPVLEHLHADPGLKPLLLPPDELRDGVSAAIADPTSWTLTPEGLTLRFPQYAVAAYAAGLPAVTLTWPELKPYMDSAFDPTILPPLLQ
jgi:uncharacterized protein YecT (DUF1311 family)